MQPQVWDIYITPGVYTAITLAAELDRVMSAQYSFLRVRFDEERQRMHFVSAGAPASFEVSGLNLPGQPAG